MQAKHKIEAAVYITYFDEVKVGGIVLPIDKIGSVEAKLTALSAELFDSIELVPETEFHASYIYRVDDGEAHRNTGAAC